jgi:hypothetical protein
MLKLAAPYVLNEDNFKVFANTVESLKTPIGHFSDMEKYIFSKKFGGLRSRDIMCSYNSYYHCLLNLLPNLRMVVIRLCKVF